MKVKRERKRIITSDCFLKQKLTLQFGKQIQSQQFTEWSPYYLDYKGLKKFISSLLNTPADSLRALGLPHINIEEDRAKLLQSQKAAFFFKLERELEKVK